MIRNFSTHGCSDGPRARVAAAWMLAATLPAAVFGHGTPIPIDGSSGALAIGAGLTLADGYARQAFDPSDEAAFDLAPGSRLRTIYPGADLAGIDPAAALQLEVLRRPDLTATGAPGRWLWHWDPLSRTVADVPGDLLLEVRPRVRKGVGTVAVRHHALTGAPTMTAATALAGSDSMGSWDYLGADQHLWNFDLVAPTAAEGFYAVFVRFLATDLEPSEPVLLAFRHGGDPGDYAEAAAAINLAAGLAGDFSSDGAVDGADMLAWQRQVGNAAGGPDYAAADGSLNGVVDGADLAVWQGQFGRGAAASAANSEPAARSVGEPSGGAGAVGIAAAALSRKRRRRGG